MHTLSTIRALVQTTVDDPSITVATIDNLINEGLIDISQKILLPDLSVDVSLSSVVDDFKVSLPDDFQRNLYKCRSENYDVSVLSSVELFLRRVPDRPSEWENGLIEYCTRSIDDLVYYPIPYESTAIHIWYYKEPTLLVADDDEPSILPGNLQRKLLHSYACKELFDDIEDGMESPRANTQRYEQKYLMALAELEAQIKQTQSRPQPGRDRNMWI